MPRRLRVPGPLAALLGATFILALAWALVTPPLQAPDENTHYGYAQGLAEELRLPGDPAKKLFSSEQDLAASLSNADQTAAQVDVKPEWDPRAYEAWRSQAARLGEAARADGSGPSPAGGNPPLYYLIEAGAYRVAGGDFFDRLLGMRLGSILWLLVAVTGVWLLAGELFARDHLRQVVAAGVAGLAPMLTFIGASVTPESMLYAMWTITLWLAVRILRHGLTVRSGFAMAATTGIACCVKVTSYALLPGVAFVLAVGLWRLRPRTTGRLAAHAGTAAAGLAATLGAWLLISRTLDRAPSNQLAGVATTENLNLRELASYLWQYYLPKTPFQTPLDFRGDRIPAFEIWIKTGWGAFGWLEVVFPGWVYGALAIITAGVMLLAAWALWRRRRALDLFVLALVVLVSGALLAALHYQDYRLLITSGGNFNQGRYLFPLIGVIGVGFATAVSALPRRHRPIAAAAVMGGLIVLQIFSFGAVLERFYA